MTSDYEPWHQPTAHWRSVLKNHEILRSLLQSEMWWDKTCCSKFVSCLSVSLWTPSKGLSLEWGPLSVNKFNRSSQIWLLPFVITTNILHWSHRSTELYQYKRYATSELRTQSQPPDPVMSCWLCTQCTPSKKAVLQCRGASTVGFSKALAPKHPTGSWKGKIPHTSPVVYQYSKDIDCSKVIGFGSLILWLFGCKDFPSISQSEFSWYNSCTSVTLRNLPPLKVKMALKEPEARLLFPLYDMYDSM